MKQHIASIQDQRHRFCRPPGSLVRDGRGRLSSARPVAFSRRDGDRHRQGGPDRPVLHARLHSHRFTRSSGASFLWLGIMIALTLTDYLSRGWLQIPGK